MDGCATHCLAVAVDSSTHRRDAIEQCRHRHQSGAAVRTVAQLAAQATMFVLLCERRKGSKCHDVIARTWHNVNKFVYKGGKVH